RGSDPLFQQSPSLMSSDSTYGTARDAVTSRLRPAILDCEYGTRAQLAASVDLDCTVRPAFAIMGGGLRAGAGAPAATTRRRRTGTGQGRPRTGRPGTRRARLLP